MFNMGPFSDKHTAATIPASIQREWLTYLLILRSEEAAPIDWVLRLQRVHQLGREISAAWGQIHSR